MVNQLLTCIDGVEKLNNILVIGMTNRKDLLDPAILRQGRIELHAEVALPNSNGRRQIFDIHSSPFSKYNAYSDDVNFDELANTTENFTGA